MGLGLANPNPNPNPNQVREFYAAWETYATSRSCAGYDKHDVRRAEDRKVRRLMEKENERARSEARRALSETVRTLVAFVKRRDWRVKEHMALAEAEASLKATRVRAARQAALDAAHAAQRPAEVHEDEEAELEVLLHAHP